MNLEMKIKEYKKIMAVVPNEKNIKETIKKSMDTFCFTEQEKMLAYGEFLWRQFGFIRKRWWCLQFLTLFLLGGVLWFLQGENVVERENFINENMIEEGQTPQERYTEEEKFLGEVGQMEKERYTGEEKYIEGKGKMTKEEYTVEEKRIEGERLIQEDGFQQRDWYMQRVLSVAGTLFIILIVPELWKSRSFQTMETEAVSYYSLHQIYAARMLLFGIVDAFLITVFCILAAFTWQVALFRLLIQFILPMAVTACICFGTLCSRYPVGEGGTFLLCMMWNAVWMYVVMNEKIYAAVTFPMWIAFLVAAVSVLVFAVYRTLRHCNDYWEVNLHEI